MTKPIIGITANVRPNPAHEDINWSLRPNWLCRREFKEPEA